MPDVFLTTTPASHGYYRELVGSAPPDTRFFWQRNTLANTSFATSPLGTAAKIGLEFLRLPNVRFAGVGGRTADLIHSCQHLLLSRQPWVVDIEHGAPFVGTSFTRLRKPFTRMIVTEVLESDSCRAILPWTETAARAFIESVRPTEAIVRKISVVYPAVGEVGPVERSGGASACHLLFVANRPDWNFYLKGGRETLEAFRILRSKGRKVTLTIVGSIPPAVGDGCERMDGITLAGIVTQSELRALYARADVYVMPSFSDTFGMVYLEAMAYGIPIVALNRPFTREIVRDRHTGLLAELGRGSIKWCDELGRFEMNSPELIERVCRANVDAAVVSGVVDRIEHLLDDDDLRHRLGGSGRQEIAAGRFSIGRRNAELSKIYLEATTGH